MRVILTFKLADAERAETRVFSPEEYFDPIEDGETYEEDAIPRLGHSWEYLGVDPGRLAYIRVEHRDDRGGLILSQLEEFYGEGRVSVGTNDDFHRDGSLASEDLVITTEIRPQAFHILRLYRKSPSRTWTLILNGLVTTQDGKPDEFTDLTERLIPPG